MKSLKTITKVALDGMIPMTMNSHRNEHNIVRKILLSVVCFTFLGMLPLCAQQAVAVLHHQGTVTSYAPGHFSDAFTDALDGDTIYFSEGIVQGDVNLHKPLTVIGAGSNTIVEGDMNVSDHCKVYNMEITGKVKEYTGSLDDLQVSQCKIGGVDFQYGGDHVVFDRCFMTYFYLYPNFFGLNVIGCKIGRLYGSNYPERITFTNCNIKLVEFSGDEYGACEATYVNSIFGEFSGQGVSNKTTYVNCLLYSLETDGAIVNAIKQNCWYNKDFSMDDDGNCSLTKNQLTAAGYLGTDNTAVGCEGGAAPYSLTPAVPRITDHTISVDSSTKKLNVTLTIGN